MFFRCVGRKKKVPPTPEEALLNALLDRAYALHDLLEDVQLDLLVTQLDLFRIEDAHGNGGELRLEELKPIEEEIGALEERLHA
jgi:hypothetical protein